MPNRPRTSQVKTPERKSHAQRTELSDTRMFNACVRLIVEQGTEKTTLKEVGESAGYSRGLAGSRFKSKTGLFCFVIRRVAEFWLDEMKTATEGRIGYAAISAVTDAHYYFCRTDPMPVRAFYILWFESAGSDTEIQKLVLSIHQRRLQDVESWITTGIEAGELAAGIDARKVAFHFLTSISGIVYQWLIDLGNEAEIGDSHEQLKQTMRLLMPVSKASKC